MRIFIACVMQVIALGLGMAGVAGTGAAQAATQPPPPSPPQDNVPSLPMDMTDIGRFSARMVPVEDDLIVRAYTRMLHERHGDNREGRALVRQHLAELGALSEQTAHEDVTIASGEFAGHWTFASPDGGLPTRAWRDIDRSGEHGYEAERIGYCRGERLACVSWFESGRDRAPEPLTEAGERAGRQWAARVMQEPCVVRPAFRPSTVPLQMAVSRAGLADAVVMLQLLHNGCGEVRQIRFVESSGDRGVDRAVAAWTRRLIAPPTDGWTGGYYSRLPFRLISLDGTDRDAEAPR